MQPELHKDSFSNREYHASDPRTGPLAELFSQQVEVDISHPSCSHLYRVAYGKPGLASRSHILWQQYRTIGRGPLGAKVRRGNISGWSRTCISGCFGALVMGPHINTRCLPCIP